MDEVHWNIIACYVVDESNIVYSVYDSLIRDGEAVPQGYGQSSILRGSPLLSTIMYYFALLQGKTSLKPPQKF